MSFLLRMYDIDTDVSDEVKTAHSTFLRNTKFTEMPSAEYNKILHWISQIKMPKSTNSEGKGNCLMLLCRSLLTIARGEFTDDEKITFVTKVNSELPLCRWSSDNMLYLDDEMQIAPAPRG
jgi:hypothetical protein